VGLHARAQIDVAITAKADIAWMWGFQSAVEGIFVAQAKDDIAAFLHFLQAIFADLSAAGKARSACQTTCFSLLARSPAATLDAAERCVHGQGRVPAKQSGHWQSLLLWWKASDLAIRKIYNRDEPGPEQLCYAAGV
jgi:hypothetical protein